MAHRLAPPVDWIAAYLKEDRAEGDITSQAIFAADHPGVATLHVRSRCFVAGVQVAVSVFERLGASCDVHVEDGTWADAGTAILTVRGPTRAILAGERLALNILGRMSGIATATRGPVEALGAACSGALVAGTRKTTPGFRVFEKQAIVIAGGVPHRMDLEEEAMIKDNHREAAGSVTAAVRAVKEAFPDKVLTTEVESLDEAMEAAAAGTDWILIDNQTPEVGQMWADAVWAGHPQVKVEASGGIGPDDVVAYGWADRISMGWLTHQAVSADVGLDWGGE